MKPLLMDLVFFLKDDLQCLTSDSLSEPLMADLPPEFSPLGVWERSSLMGWYAVGLLCFSISG